MSESMGLSDTDKEVVQVAGMLHDVWTWPLFSYAGAHTAQPRGQRPHDDNRGHNYGFYDVVDESESSSFKTRQTIPETLEKHGIDPKEISKLIRGPDASGSERSLFDWKDGSEHFQAEDVTLANMAHGPVDCDQIDYPYRRPLQGLDMW